MTITSPPPPAPPPPTGFPAAPPLEAPPESRSAEFGGTRRPAGSRRATAGPPHLLASELALAAVTGAAVFGFSRVFEGFGFLWPLLVIGGAMHLGAAFLRRRGVGIAAAFVALSGIWALLITWLFFRETTFALLPTNSTLDVAGAELDRSWSAFRELVAPAPALTGFVLAAALAVGVAVFLADWAAFRMWSTRDAMVPSLTLFVFATLLAGDSQRISSAVLYLGAGLTFVLVHRVARLERSTGWVTSERRAGGRALLRVGVLIALAAIVLGAVIGPRLPGVDEPAILDWRGGQRTSGRVTVSPLVDIRSRLVERSDTEVFQVQSDQPAYWRMTALDDFDGNIWRSKGSYDEVSGSLPTTTKFPLRTTEVLTQTYRIQSLSTLWLPAAFEPLDVESTVPVRYQQATSTLIVDPGATSADGASYTVQSAITNFTAAQLTAANATIPPEISATLDLPSDFSDSARQTAEDIVAGASTRYDQAMALQAFFRDSGGFVYDLDVKSGHSGNAIDEFLDKRRGYCEQFAGTFAAMARSVGIPARVAVGFTWGDDVPDQPGTFQVRGRNAHAWPEVFLGEYGWVAFEPTPGRGAPNAQGYTGQAPSQEAPPDSSSSTPSTTVEPSPTTTAPADATTPNGQSSELLRSESAAAASTAQDGGWSVSVRVVLVVLLTLVAGYGLLVPGSRAWHHRRRRKAAAGDPPAEVSVAWNEVSEELALLRVRPQPDETHHELARRAGGVLPEQSSALGALADAADAAAFGPDAVGTDLATQARQDADAVIEAVVRRVPGWRRTVSILDPRPRHRRPAPTRHEVDRPHD